MALLRLLGENESPTSMAPQENQKIVASFYLAKQSELSISLMELWVSSRM
jgi:hypothetical protein